jgi:8-oxo-dGTP diphosphatase
MEKNRPKVGILIFVIRDGKVLLGKRKGPIGDGMWGLPGGHLEFGEKWTDSAKRELLEETGLVAESMHLLSIINDPLPADNSHYIHISFLADDFFG